MRRLVLLIAAITIGYANASTQSCLPQGIAFTTQAQIDNFQTKYAGCTHIDGNVIIDGSGITNLNGLSVLSSIGGDLRISLNVSLSSLSGLENVTSIAGNLEIMYSFSLTSLLGLEGLTSIGGNLEIKNSYILASLTGLEGLTTIGGSLDISSNTILISLAGLESLTTIVGDLTIIKNSSLSTCDMQWLCDNLAAPEGRVIIYDNASGCSMVEIAYACGGLPCLPYGDYYINSQSDIDNFFQAFPDCFELEGEININGQDITNLNGLGHITSANNDLKIFFNPSLTSLTGLDNLSSIGGKLWISHNSSMLTLTGLSNLVTTGGGIWISSNSSMTSLTGLENLASIGGNFDITFNSSLPDLNELNNLSSIGGNLHIHSNSSLTNLSGLNNLTFIGDRLSINFNSSLTSLTGLDNLTTLGGVLNIIRNSSLSTCDEEWLCDYLSAPDGPVRIYDNAAGCDLIQIAYACGGLSCLPYGDYYFHSQSEIDNFIQAFPACYEPEGDFIISGNDITNLNGLSHITSIGGNLELSSNPSLASLTGLESLNSIGEDLRFSANSNLINLTGLESLTSIGGDFRIASSPSLTSLAGLDNLVTIGGEFRLSSFSLTNLTGLDNLTSIGSNFSISSNSTLINLIGLGGLTSIGGSFRIENTSITSLAGLNNLTSIGGGMNIMWNRLLSACDDQWLCNYLAAPGGPVLIYNNATGCDLIQIAFNCGGVSCLPDGEYYFIYQPDIDVFSQAFPGCYELEGNVMINGFNNITSLNGLNQITSIGGSLGIYDLHAASSLSGLDNLTSIGDNLEIKSNSSLFNLTGLDGLTSIGGNLEIRDNSSLNTFNGLDGLTSIGDFLEISGNSDLTSLTGIDNIEAGSITYLYIGLNPSLSTCAVQSVCDYLASPNAYAITHTNAPGCNNHAEIMEACKSIGIEEAMVESGFIVFPNPFSENLSIEFSLDKPCQVSVMVYNNMGQVVARTVERQFQPGMNRLHLESPTLSPGFYFLRLQAGDVSVTRKIIKY